VIEDFSNPSHIPLHPRDIAAIVAAREARTSNKNIISYVLTSGCIGITNMFETFTRNFLTDFNKTPKGQRYQIYLLYYDFDEHWLMLDIKKINYNTCQIIVVDSVHTRFDDSLLYVEYVIKETRKKLNSACKNIIFKQINISVQTDIDHCAIFSLNAGFRLSTIPNLHELVQKINSPLNLNNLPCKISLQLLKLKQFCSVDYKINYKTKYGNKIIKNKTLDDFIKEHNNGFSFKKKTLEYMKKQNIFLKNIQRLLYQKT
jgi:hypothetical protein